MKNEIINFSRKYFYLLTAFFVFVVYLFTIAPSVVQIDSGELAAVQITLGIAHPTGYPLFTIIGYFVFFDSSSVHKNFSDEFTCCNLLQHFGWSVCLYSKVCAG